MFVRFPRVLVDASIYDEFKSKFVQAVSKINVGDPSSEATVMGSVISKDHQNKVENYINLGLEEGGIVLTGGTSSEQPEVCQVRAPSFAQRSSTASATHHARQPRKSSAPLSPFTPSPRKTKPSRWPTAPTTVSQGRCGPPILPAVMRLPSVLIPALSGQHVAQPRPPNALWWRQTIRVGREGGSWSLNFFSELTNICVQEPLRTHVQMPPP